MKTILYTLTLIKAIAECAGDTDIQDAILVHLNDDEFKDGDCILFGYSINDFENDSDITEALINNAPISAYTIDHNGIYHA